MESLQETIAKLMENEYLFAIIRAVIIVIAGFIVAKFASTMAVRVMHKRMSTHQLVLTRRGAYYLVLVLFLLSALHQLGFDLTILLGAAGILSVAIGFASQTSASNLISGLFLLGEQPFGIGDVIKVGDITGEVLAIDLLSVKLRTFDNLYVRIPNENLLTAEVTTLTRFPIRRIDLEIGVAYKENIETVRDVLMDLAQRNPFCLTDPEPLFILKGFGASSIDILLCVWVRSANFLKLKNGLLMEIKTAFDERGIEIPYPHLTLYAGSVSDPFEVKLKDEPQIGKDAAPGAKPAPG
jgi:small-conductance mechanosensitive channel